LTACCGLGVHITTQALKSAKGLGNTFDSNPKSARTRMIHGIFIEASLHYLYIEVGI
jgi:hypothetical protein